MLKTRLLTAASGLVALVIALGATASLSAQSTEVVVELQVAARISDPGRVEFALRDADREFWVPENRFLTSVQRGNQIGKWLRSSAIQIGAITARVNAMPREDGGVEFGIEVDDERHEPTRNILSANQIDAVAGRWIVSTPVTITVSVDNRTMQQIEASGGVPLSQGQCRGIYNQESLMGQSEGLLYIPEYTFSARYLSYLGNTLRTSVDQKVPLFLAQRALDRYDRYLSQCRDVTIDLRADAYSLSQLRQQVAQASRNPLNRISAEEERCLDLQHGETIRFDINELAAHSYDYRQYLYRGRAFNFLVYPVLSLDLARDLAWLPSGGNEEWRRTARYVSARAQQFIELCDGTLELSFDGQATKPDPRSPSGKMRLMSYLFYVNAISGY